MGKEEKIDFKIDYDIVKDYANTMNSTSKSMNQIKKELGNEASSDMEPVKKMYEQLESYIANAKKEQAKIYEDTIKQIMKANNGMLSTRMIEPLNISRQYLSILEKHNVIEKVSRGIYILPSNFEDSYFSFQQKHKKAIFSHMNALYFYGMTEEFPYSYTVTVPQRYHANKVNEKCNVFYVPDDIYELGVVEVKTPSGNKVRAYDKERTICDIIRSMGRMDNEQVKKAIKNYVRSHDKDIAKISEYSKKMGINKKVMKVLGDII